MSWVFSLAVPVCKVVLSCHLPPFRYGGWCVWRSILGTQYSRLSLPRLLPSDLPLVTLTSALSVCWLSGVFGRSCQTERSIFLPENDELCLPQCLSVDNFFAVRYSVGAYSIKCPLSDGFSCLVMSFSPQLSCTAKSFSMVRFIALFWFKCSRQHIHKLDFIFYNYIRMELKLLLM